MLNNGHGGIGTPEGSHGGGHAMYGGGHPGGPVEYKFDPSNGPVEYKYDPSKGGHMDYKYDPSKGPGGDFKYDHPSNYLGGPSPPGGMNGVGGGPHHSGGYCSQMSFNRNNQCPPNTKYFCSGCQGPILERFVFKCLDQHWHHSCLKCSLCFAPLADVGTSCFTRDGMILCKKDYQNLRIASGTCNLCGQGIAPTEFVMRAGGPHSGVSPTLVYHVNCFQCSKCKCLLNTGDRYSVVNGAVFCEQDALKLIKNGIGSPSNAHVPNSNGPAVPPKKGKVGRPRRSRD